MDIFYAFPVFPLEQINKVNRARLISKSSHFSGSQQDGGGGCAIAKARVVHSAVGERNPFLQGAARKCLGSDEGGALRKGSNEQVSRSPGFLRHMYSSYDPIQRSISQYHSLLCCRSEEANVYSTMLARWQNDVIAPGREEELRTLRLENARLRDQLIYHSSAVNG